jgi:hypothetical protein
MPQATSTFNFGTSTTAYPFLVSQNGQSSIVVRSNGLVGINTNNPAAALDVNGDIVDENIKSVNCIGTTPAGTLQLSSNCITSTAGNWTGTWQGLSTSSNVMWQPDTFGIHSNVGQVGINSNSVNGDALYVNGTGFITNLNTQSISGLSIANSLLGTNIAGSVQATTIGSGLLLSGGTLSVSSTLASTSATFGFSLSTTTAPYNFQAQYTNTGKIFTWADCTQATNNATTTITIGYATSSAAAVAGNIGQTMISSLACGFAQNSTTSFTTSTLPINTWLITKVTATAGSPTNFIADIAGYKF